MPRTCIWLLVASFVGSSDFHCGVALGETGDEAVVQAAMAQITSSHGCTSPNPDSLERLRASEASVTWVSRTYPRFDVFIDSAYYDHNAPQLDSFLTAFVTRFSLLEDRTGWSSEENHGSKLNIYLRSTQGCWFGFALPGEAHVSLSDPLYSSSCRKAYYEGGQRKMGNTAELGDYWYYMSAMLHETLHAIGPLAFYARPWLTEGISTFYELRILFESGDINAETVETYLRLGGPYYSWTCFTHNDYRDCTPENLDLQHSAAYEISAWMLFMMERDHFFDWSHFYVLVDNNKETTGRSLQFYPFAYYVDSHIIDLMGRAAGLTPDSIRAIFRYDSPAGPGWGIRYWEDLDWYADLTAVLAVSDSAPVAGDSVVLSAAITNSGEVSLEDVKVRFYDGSVLLQEMALDCAAKATGFANAPFRPRSGSFHRLSVIVNEDGTKIEQLRTNNEDSIDVIFSGCGPDDSDGDGVADFCDSCLALATPDNVSVLTGDVNADGRTNATDLILLVRYILLGIGTAPQPIDESGDVNCDSENSIADIWYLVNYVFRGGDKPCDVCSLQ